MTTMKTLFAALLFCAPAWAGSLSLDGVDDLATTTTPVITDYPYSIHGWGKPASLASSLQFMNYTNTAAGDNFNQVLFTIIVTTGVHRHRVVDASSFNNADTTNAASVGAWAHMGSIGTSATNRRAILNGDLVGAANNTTSRQLIGMNRFNIGAIIDAGGSSGWWNGLIGPTAVWRSARSDEDIVALSRGWSPWRIDRRNLAFYAPYPEAGSSIKDWIAGNNLTLTGTTDSTDGPPARP